MALEPAQPLIAMSTRNAVEGKGRRSRHIRLINSSLTLRTTEGYH
jgi:hypothetical protein